MSRTRPSAGFATLLQDFFLRHLTAEKRVSPRTIESYRDTFRLLLRHAKKQLRREPVDLTLGDLDAPLLLGFLDSLENERGNSIRTRNTRLAAVKSFLRYAASREVTSLPVLQRSLAIPTKRCDKPVLGYLSRDEMDAVLEACDRSSWSGERDYVLLSLAYNTGARVSELIALKIEDVDVVRSPAVRIMGKGRKLRTVPLWKETARLLRQWIDRLREPDDAPVFPNRWRRPMTRSGVEKRLRTIVVAASKKCPSLAGRSISPHTLRHSTAMHMLQGGVDIVSLALWLGHSSPTTTHGYVEADLAMKERALQKVLPPDQPAQRFRADDRLLAFLDTLGK